MRRKSLAIGLSLAALAACRVSTSPGDSPLAASGAPIGVAVLTCDGCSQTDSAIASIEETARRIAIPVEVSRVRIETAEDARKHRFLGSPTVQVDGEDIDPAARQRTDFGLG